MISRPKSNLDGVLMNSQNPFYGPNAGYIFDLYDRFKDDPDQFDPVTRDFFTKWSPWSMPETTGNGSTPTTVDAAPIDLSRVVGAVSYAQAIRQFGHLQASINPLGFDPPGDPSLSPDFHGITEDDLRSLPPGLIDGPAAANAANMLDVINNLKAIYCNSIGFDNEHIHTPKKREWLREAVESRRYQFQGSDEEARAVLDRLTQIETFEQFLQRSFPTKYRFSIEGLDMLVVMLDEIVNLSADSGVETCAVAMAHRGRLNVLAHVMKKPYDQILADFKDPLELAEMQDAIGWTVDDVKYHKAWRREVTREDGKKLLLTMPPNPSHLEAVNPVAVGMARAAGTIADEAGEGHFLPRRTMQILIHGDAAFPGQGIVAETFNLSRLPGYWTGGTIHFIANNQLGFTTLPEDGRSTLYASDLAEGFKVPIIHVNADDPAACIEVARIAYGYQKAFEQDILVDLIGYRRYGHNELDEPGFTQPRLYETIRQHPTVREMYEQQLIERGVIQEDEINAIEDKYEDMLQQAYDNLNPQDIAEKDKRPAPPEPGMARKTSTAVNKDHLLKINKALEETLEGFEFYSRRFEKTIRNRRTVLDDFSEQSIDWATAEELAFATILADGTPIRLTGQDTERGTFSHRHAVLHDGTDGNTLVPLQKFSLAKAAFEVRNSPLSEQATLGFEYGYSIQASDRLVVWEAQYGDFINGAQNIVDEFITSAREKWGQTPSLVMLLPHGHEGAGPDHSSGRLERFLQLSAQQNMRVANCTTAAQYFHLLRRQALLLKTDPLPLIVMAPKSLLRNPAVFSSPEELVSGKWQPVIDDPTADPEKVTRLVLVSGKFYFDLMTGINEQQANDANAMRKPDEMIKPFQRDEFEHVAVVRVEQLYPFPSSELKEILDKYTNVTQIVWAQEEPKNMGAWEFMGYRLKKLVGMDIPVNYVGRRRSSSPAEGSKTAHQVNQAMISYYAFAWQFKQNEPTN